MELSKLEGSRLRKFLLEDNLQERLNQKALFEMRLNHLRQIREKISIPVKGMPIQFSLILLVVLDKAAFGCMVIILIYLGLDQLHNDINYDWSSSSINSLGEYNGDKIVFTSPESALPLGNMDIMFDNMLTSRSSLFIFIWEQKMKNVASSIERKERADLTIEDIRTVLWDVTFKECSDLLDSLYNRTIKLREVEFYFGKVKQSSTIPDTLKGQLLELCRGVHNCMSSDRLNNITWIDGVVQDICCFWSMLTLTEEARAVIELKTNLLLSDDFEKVEILVNPVSNYS